MPGTVGTVLAKSMKLYIGTSTPVAVTCQVDASISMSTNMIQTSCKDSGADGAYLPGEKSWTASGSGNFAFDATYGESQLFAAWKDQTVVAVVFQNTVVGDKKYSGNTYITSLSFNSSGNDEAVTFDFELQGTGALVEATIS